MVISGDTTADQVTFAPLSSNGSDITQTGVESFTVFANAGDDIVNGGTFAAPLTLSGGAGNDQLTGGLGNDTLNAGDGNDLINGNAGTDALTYGSTVRGRDGQPRDRVGADHRRVRHGHDRRYREPHGHERR